MATITVNRSDLFPVGTEVGLYASAGQGVNPEGPAIDSETVASSGAVTFSGVDADRPYVLYALVSGQHRYLSVRSSTSSTPLTWAQKVAARIAAAIPPVEETTQADYFVDQVAGDDENDGTEAEPWQTLSKVAAFTFQAGDVIALKRGGRWAESLAVPRADLSFIAYGGDPVVDGSGYVINAPVIDGGSAVAGWSEYVAGTYQATVDEPDLVDLAGSIAVPGANKDTLNDGEWVWEAGELYVRREAGEPSDTEVIVNARAGVTVSSKDNTHIEGLGFEHHSGRSVDVSSSTGVTVDDCYVQRCEVPSPANALSDDVATVTGCLVRDCRQGVTYHERVTVP